MCQNNEDDINSVLESKPDFKKYQKCLKCDQSPVVVTRVSEALCKPCFMEYFVHKFRATVGKNVKKLLERDELVLFAYSASGSSVAMLNLLAKGVGEEAKKKFTFQPVVLYIEDKVLFDPTKSQTDRIESLKEIKKTCDYSNFRIYFSLFENCLLGDDSTSQESLFTNEIEKLEFNSDRTKQFLDLVNESSNGTSREELLKRLKLKLINNVAKRLKISKIMLATNCTKLTIDLLNNVSIGKGAHVSWETSLEEKCPDGILYLRPFRELTSKEIAFYNHFIGKNDSILSNNSSLMNLPNSTIYRLTEKFICGLQSDYPSTVSTLFRTSDKLTPCDDLIDCNHMCCLCESPLDTNSSAIDDLEFSRSLAKISLNNNITENFSVKDENHNLSEFCYSCSVIIGDLKNKQNLPLYLKEKLRENMKSKINDCLIQD